jgi:hypothetical protein
MRSRFAVVAFAFVTVAALAGTPAHADDTTPGEQGRPVDKGTFGIGLALGEPTGICAKLYLRDDQAIQGVVGEAFIGQGIQVHVDYVFHPWILQDKQEFVLPVYLGPGFRFIDYTPGEGDADHVALGLRAVIGMLFDFKNVPLDVFAEVAAVGQYDLKDGWGAAINGDAGVRYYF